MAAIPPTRTRSLRATAPGLNRTQQQSNNNASTTMATTSTRRGQAAAEPAQNGPSPLSLFLTNLRLLDLDLLPDWPGISAATFTVAGSGTGAAQAQKRRVGCVEWTLFRLFEIFDAEETRAKLKPYFPPQDQVSSVNLRAAMLRGLEAAKKSGVLGKDTILRKTMLDDCRGERLEEVLAAFSTAVLKMVVAEEESAGSAASAVSLALESRGYQDDKTDLQVMGLVHRAALSRMLRQRKETGAKFKDFEDLLSVKDRGLKRRMEEVKALTDMEKGQRGKTVSSDAVREMRHTVRNNWAGNEQWMDALMYGDAKPGGGQGGPFGMPFERVWRRVEQSRLEELENGGVGLLEQLERRVRGHEERLAKWERFRDGLRGGARAPARNKEEPKASERGAKGLDLGFGAHASLQVGKIVEDATARESAKSTQLGTATKQDTFARDLERDLEQASGTGMNPMETMGFLFDRRPVPKEKDMLRVSDASQGAVSEISDLEEEDALDGRRAEEEAVRPLGGRLEGLKRYPVRPKLSQPTSSLVQKDLEDDEEEVEVPKKEPWTKNAPKLPHPQRVPSYGEEAPQHAPRVLPTRTRTTSSSRPRVYSRSRSISPEKHQQIAHPREPPKEEDGPPRSPTPEEIPEETPIPDEPPPEPVSPTQDMADEILKSMKNASPSPAKPSRPRHKLSLAERTRMSMARGSLLFADEDQEPAIPSQPEEGPSPAAEDTDPSPAEDLASRTRRSMAGFEKARQKAQLDRRRSIRKSKAMGPPIKEGSYFPKVSEEEGQSVLAEELLGEEEDMEKVFMSRPKIKASPPGSPVREWA